MEPVDVPDSVFSELPTWKLRRSLRFRRPVAIDLFAGCGGMSLGLQAAGFDVRAAVEMDHSAAMSYRRNVGFSPIERDIRAVSGRQLLRSARLRPGECFVLAACPPCQGFSFQRRRNEGCHDPRNALVFDVIRIVRAVRPSYVLFENVPGLFQGVGKSLYQEIISLFHDLGYRVDDGVMDAADFGVPQHRTRLLALCSHESMPPVSLPSATHIEFSDTPHPSAGKPQWRTVFDAIGELPPLASGEADVEDPLHVAASHGIRALQRIQAIPTNGGSRSALPPDLVLACHRDHKGHNDVYGRMWWNRPSPTITGGCTKPSKGRFIHPDQHRAITPREAALLQGFPARAWFAGSRDKVAEQIGNAVPPDFVKAVAQPVMQIHRSVVCPGKRVSIDVKRSRRTGPIVCGHRRGNCGELTS